MLQKWNEVDILKYKNSMHELEKYHNKLEHLLLLQRIWIWSLERLAGRFTPINNPRAERSDMYLDSWKLSGAGAHTNIQKQISPKIEPFKSLLESWSTLAMLTLMYWIQVSCKSEAFHWQGLEIALKQMVSQCEGKEYKRNWMIQNSPTDSS